LPSLRISSRVSGLLDLANVRTVKRAIYLQRDLLG
jgi:hypothetical protein